MRSFIINISFHEMDTMTQIQIIMDSTKVGVDSIWTQKQNRILSVENRIESLSRRLWALHSARCRTLKIHRGKY